MASSIMKNKKSVDEKLSDSLETTFETKEEVTKGRKVTEIQVNAVDSEKDYWLVRKNMKELISTGEEAIDGILKVATEGDSHRAYEVAAQMIKTVADVNKDLMDLHLLPEPPALVAPAEGQFCSSLNGTVNSGSALVFKGHIWGASIPLVATSNPLRLVTIQR